MIKTARLFYAFWDTGNAEYVSAAVDNDFRDNTLPEGRSQGPKGLLYASQTFRSAVPAGELKYEFDQLYAEAATRRRMMSVSAHDRITGRPARTKALEEFIIYAQKQPGVVFLRKDQIARFALESSATPREGSLIQPRAAA
jgi:peptidoglycan/xylan/chitin deacetylase (PgdA/CDA1 family)